MKEKEIVYRGDILCARCIQRHICRFGGIEEVESTGKCEEFKRDFDVIYKRKKNE
jgi:hypothetical protein